MLCRLVPADAAPYRQLMLQAYTAHPDAFTSSAAERSALPLAWWEARLAVGDAASEVVWGAFTGDELAGVAGLSFESREKARHKATLFGMYLLPQARGQGLGEQLVHALLDHARSRPSVKQVLLTVTEGNAAAVALYTRCGFVAWGVEPDAVAVDGAFVSKVHMVWRVKPMAV
jgi:RimJ/RimL family protein N-acetyltransferase